RSSFYSAHFAGGYVVISIVSEFAGSLHSFKYAQSPLFRFIPERLRLAAHMFFRSFLQIFIISSWE
ncbi:MAG: hypothetical protein KKD01_16210, partial [Proteobacteria bacterium]|nr:hypothetical protein [Pseudomonadota bacterium]